MTPLVVAETNFILQIVLQRDDADIVSAAESILHLAGTQRIRLLVPAFSLLEAASTFRSAEKRRNRLATELQPEERELARSPLSQSAAQELRAFRASLAAIANQESTRFLRVYEILLATSGTIDLEAGVLAEALSIGIKTKLSLADAVVLASCLKAFRDVPKRGEARLFITQNSRDFDSAEVRRRLKAVDAELLTYYRACQARLSR